MSQNDEIEKARKLMEGLEDPKPVFRPSYKDDGPQGPTISEMERLSRLMRDAELVPTVHELRREMTGTMIPSRPEELFEGGQSPILIGRTKKIRTLHGHIPLDRPVRVR